MNVEDTKIKAASYAEHIEALALDFRKMALSGKLPSITEVVDLIGLDEDNRVISDLCVELKIATKAEFKAEIMRERQRKFLGIAPANATQLVESYVKKQKIVARMDGLMTRDVGATFLNDDGTTTPISEDDRKDALMDLYAAFHCDVRKRFNRMDFERELRILSDNYRMGIHERAISDAVAEWLAGAYRARLYDIFGRVEGDRHKERTDKIWTELASEVFDCSATSADYITAVFKKFIWQVKRKMRGMPVYNHLMPVILGPQGIGKSTLVNKMVEPIEELKLNVDFQMITDERNMDIWSSYVLFLDEMGYATKADIDSVKNIITASTLTRRPMRTNSQVTIDQKATLIGCSNKELEQLVRDPTGIRRFVGIRMRSDADREFINSIDWKLLWCSVRVDDADPMADFASILAAQQEESRERSQVEQWMADFDGTGMRYQSAITKSGKVPASNLYEDFREYADTFYPGQYRISKSEWDYEMKRLRENTPDVVVFDHMRSKTGVMYKWRNRVEDPVVLNLNSFRR